MTAMTGVIMLFFSPLTSIIGHLYVEKDSNSVVKYYNFFHTFNFIIGVVFFLGYYAVIDNLVELCFCSNVDDLVLMKPVSFIITLNYFIQFMRQATFLFRDATGTFYNDRWKPLFEGLLNVGLSIGFVFLFSWLFGDEFAIVGVIVATIITNLTICYIVEPHVLCKYAFRIRTTKYFIRNYSFISLFTVALVALHFSLQSYSSDWKELFVNGCISIGIAVIPCILVIAVDKDFRHYIAKTLKKLTNKVKRHKVENNDLT